MRPMRFRLFSRVLPSRFLHSWAALSRFLTGLAALALMAYYNTHGKKTGLLGNAVVSFNVALPFFFGGLAVGNLRPLLFIFFLLAFLANMAREIAKGIGVDPQNIQIQPDTKFLDPLDREKAEIRAYMTAIRDELRKPPTDEIPRNH